MSATRVTTLRPHAVSVEEMLDNFALQQLAWTYCHAVDRQDYALLRSLYHDDAIDDHGPMFHGSADDYVAWLPSMLAKWDATAHVITNMLFLIDGNSAEGELSIISYQRARPPKTHEMTVGGRYLDRYEKRDGVWRFLRRSLALDWKQSRTVERRDSPLDGERGQPGFGDPCFQRLAMFRAQYGGSRPDDSVKKEGAPGS